MILGIPKEGEILKGLDEKRVGLSPAGLRDLDTMGAEIFVAADAGAGAGFRSGGYRSAGAHIVYSNEEMIRRSDLKLELTEYRIQKGITNALKLGKFQVSGPPAEAGSNEGRNLPSWKLCCRQGCQRYRSFVTLNLGDSKIEVSGQPARKTYSGK